MYSKELQNYNIQFITHQTEKYDYYQSAKIALEGGIRWIQLRMKNAPLNAVKEEAIRIQYLCKQYSALFFIDDYVELAIELHADGVHLGQNDMPINDARKLCGNLLYIGGTANTFQQIEKLSAEGVDYIGLGPLRNTSTKINLSPILGVEGIQAIIEQCRSTKLRLPIYVIGGVQKEDITRLIHVGATGIAISSAIVENADPVKESALFVTYFLNNKLI